MSTTSASSHGNSEPIALIGIACEYAGGIHSANDLWRVLSESIDVGGPIPETRFDLDSFLADSSDIAEGSKIIRRGYFLSDEVIEQFDPTFFGISDREALCMDPCHRLLLQKFMHLLDDANYTIDSVYGSKTSVHIGQYTFDHHAHVYRQNMEYRPAIITPQMGLYNGSARISYHYNLQGPNLTLDSACSSSLQAVDLAVQSLRSREADLGVAGGVNLCYTPEALAAASQLPIVSWDGRSRSFSAHANGYAKGEGIALVLLKRLSDAERDGDRIYCVIHDIMSNHDGKIGKNAYVVPSFIGQERLLRNVYEKSGIDPKSIFYVECHGTGTQIGDPIETNTIGKFFARSSEEPPLLIGSIKNVIGHTEGASGVSSLIKGALCVYKGCLTPNMHFEVINPRIKAQEYNLHVVTNMTYLPAPEDAPCFIGINSFGMGGNNCHAILNRHDDFSRKQSTKICKSLHDNTEEVSEKLTLSDTMPGEISNSLNLDESRQHYIFTFTAKSKKSLQLQAKAMAKWLAQIPADNNVSCDNASNFMAALSKKLLLHRTTSFEQRLSFIASDLNQLKAELESFLMSSFSTKYVMSERNVKALRSVCFIFGGQGPQWWAMGRQLYNCEATFRTWINRIDYELRLLTNEWTLINELITCSNEKESRINDTNIAQPALFGIQVALTALWISWGVRPSAIIGHSLGEIAAIFVAGRLTLKEAVTVVYHRARLQHRNTRQNGLMVAVNLNENTVRDFLRGIEDEVCIAAINSHKSVTLSGNNDTLAKVIDAIKTLHPNVVCSWLRIENAFHSHQMERHDIQASLCQSLKDISGRIADVREIFDVECSKAQLYSTVVGGRVDTTSIEFNAKYWWKNVRQPVMFYSAVQALIEENSKDPLQFFLEISPHPVLSSALEDIVGSSSRILASLKRKHDEEESLLGSLCYLIDSTESWQKWLQTRHYYKNIDSQHIETMLADLPLYAFEKSTCWYETKDSIITRRANRRKRHPLLGYRFWTRPYALWKNFISLSKPELLYLRDHRINDVILFPAAGFLEMLLAAADQSKSLTAKNIISLEKVQLLKALEMKENQSIEIHTIILLSSYDIYIFSRVSSHEDYVRPGGIASNEILGTYSDVKLLQEYKEEEWTLHVRAYLNLNFDHALEATFYRNSSQKYHGLRKTASWALEDTFGKKQLYDSLEYRGYQYGSNFQSVQAVYGSDSEVSAEVSHNNNNDDYYFHPTTMDGCLQSTLLLLPKHQTYVPTFINKITFSRIDLEKIEQMNFGVFVKYKPIVRGISATDESYTTDLWIMSGEKKDLCVISITGFKVQSITCSLDILNPKASIFDKLNKFTWLSNIEEHETDLEKIFSEYCFESVWIQRNRTKVDKNSIATSMKPDDLFMIQILLKDGSLHQAHDLINTGCNEADEAAKNSLVPSTRWISDIAKYVLSKITGQEEIKLTRLDSIIITKYRQLVDVLLELAGNHQNETRINRFDLCTQYVELVKLYPQLISIFTLMHSCIDHLEQFLLGREDPLEWLFRAENESYLQQYYTTMSQTNTEVPFQAIIKFFERNGTPDHLNVLEIGAGTGGSTLHVLDLLLDFANRNDVPIFYMFTDISPSFFASAESRIAHLLETKNRRGLLTIRYHVLNIDNASINLRESFDIVFASNVIHATKNIVLSLQNIRQLLVPGGLVVLVELCLPIPYLDFIFGLLPQWWLPEEHDDQVRQGKQRAIISVDMWKEAFDISRGYSDFRAASSEIGLTTIIAKKTAELGQLVLFPELKERVWIIFCDKHQGIGRKLAASINETKGQTHVLCVFYETMHSANNVNIVVHGENSVLHIDLVSFLEKSFQQYSQIDIVFTWGLDLQFSLFPEQSHGVLFDLQEQLCLNLLKIVQLSQSRTLSDRRPTIFILTSNAQTGKRSENHNFLQSPLIGFGRAALHEYDHDYLKLIDINANGEISSTLLKHLTSLITSKQHSSDNEIVLKENSCGDPEDFVLRYVPVNNLSDETSKNNLKPNTINPNRDLSMDTFCLEIPKSKFLADLRWVTDETIHPENLSPSEVLVQISCVGLIFRDLLQVQGLYPSSDAFSSDPSERDTCVGLEFSGTVLCLGNEAKETYTVGDRVFGIVLRQGAFRSHIVVDMINITKAPDGFSMEQLASLPIAFLTILLALKERVRLTKNQTCLIHSASGAVGLAAIQYCRLVGASVIATAGTEEKRTFLREKIGIDHVFNSRDLSFVTDVLEIAPLGVDVIVNSLTGAFMQHSVDLLAPNGHFVELGKRDIYSNAILPMFQFRRECTWHVIDAFAHHRRQPQMTQTLLRFTTEHLKMGSFTSINPLTVFERDQIVDAFTTFQRASHIGKLVVRIISDTNDSECLPKIGVNGIAVSSHSCE